MLPHQENLLPLEANTIPPVPIQEVSDDRALTETVISSTPKRFLKIITKQEIRSSLRALTFESIFATIFYSIIGGALLSNFLLELGAGTVEIGLLAAIPQVVNLLQPLGAYLVNRSVSFRKYCLSIFLPPRLLWLILLPAIWLVQSSQIAGHQVVQLTLAILLIANIIEAFGRAPWLGWNAVLVPEKLRGRYFGFRSSVLGLTNFVAVPLLGLIVSVWPGGMLQGYSAVLIMGMILGIISIVCQMFMSDVNPQALKMQDGEISQNQKIDFSLLKDTNFLKFILYLSIWCFAVNICAPFFNLYLLDNLDIDISVVTVYHGLGTAANMLMLLVWGKLADRIGNRPLLILVGVLVAITPLLWLAVGNDAISFWVYLPLLHILAGGTWAAIDLCTNNMMMGITPLGYQSSYFAIAGAVAGITGALAITIGSFLATLPAIGGLLGLFVLSGLLRMLALVSLVFVEEQGSMSLPHIIRILLPIPQVENVINVE